jgi:hypothetical protein
MLFNNPFGCPGHAERVFFELFHMNKKASKCPVPGFFDNLIAKEKLRIRVGGSSNLPRGTRI